MTGPRSEVHTPTPHRAPVLMPEEPAAGLAPFLAELPADVLCPGCGTTSVVDGVRRKAHDFCAACNYPLFWAAPRRATLPAEVAAQPRLRQLPPMAAAAPPPVAVASSPPVAVATLPPVAVATLPPVAVASPPRPAAAEPVPVAPVSRALPQWQQEWDGWWVGLAGLLVLLLDIVVLAT